MLHVVYVCTMGAWSVPTLQYRDLQLVWYLQNEVDGMDTPPRGHLLGPLLDPYSEGPITLCAPVTWCAHPKGRLGGYHVIHVFPTNPRHGVVQNWSRTGPEMVQTPEIPEIQTPPDLETS